MKLDSLRDKPASRLSSTGLFIFAPGLCWGIRRLHYVLPESQMRGLSRNRFERLARQKLLLVLYTLFCHDANFTIIDASRLEWSE